jgi:predicted dienelactone hydrolase
MLRRMLPATAPNGVAYIKQSKIYNPGDNFWDMCRSGDLSLMVDRPTDIKRLIDFMLGASPAASNIDAERIGFFGFSRGGYTGLVLIDGDPDWASDADFCPQSSFHSCDQIRRKEFPALPLAQDARIKAAVIADPLAVFFTADSFAASRCRSSYGRRSLAAMACRPRVSPPWTGTYRQSTSITWCRMPGTSRF